MIASAGYTYTSTFLNTAFFKRLIIPNNSKELSSLSTTALNVSNATPVAIGADGSNPSFVRYDITTPTHTTLGAFTTSDSKTYTYGGTPPLVGKAKLTFTNVVFDNQLSAGLTIYLGGTSGFYSFEDIQDTKATLEIEADINFATSNTIFPYIAFDGAIPFSLSYDSVVMTITATSLIPVPLNLGEAIKMNDTIPRGIFQKDFFTSTLKLFNLMAVEDKFIEKHLIIEPYVDFYTGTILDWSDKMDRSKPIRLKPMSEATARYYELKWKQDNDFYNEDYRKKYNEGYGDRIFDNGLEFAKDKETVDVIFAASTLYGKTGEDKVYPAIYKKSNNNTVEDPIEHVVRLMQVKKITGVASWKIYDDNHNLGSNTTYLYAGHFDDPDVPNADLNFGATKELFFTLAAGNLSNNLFNTYYSPYLAEITDKDSRLITANFKLMQLDIFNLDFSKFIYIDGGLYRLSKVIDYSPELNEVTKCELLRVINKVY
jgi:hypothetical protein